MASFPGSVKSFGADRVNGEYIPASDNNDLRAEVVAIETALLNGGWLGISDAWQYASASSFTVAGDKTSIYTRGTRIKFTQTTVKYAIVLSSSYGAPNTTVTIVVNTDYTIANATISGQAISNLVDPRGWPDFFNWVPVWTNLTDDLSFDAATICRSTSVRFVLGEVISAARKATAREIRSRIETAIFFI